MKRIYYPIVMFLPYFVVAIMWLLSLGGFDYQMTVTSDPFYLVLFFWSIVGACICVGNEAEKIN